MLQIQEIDPTKLKPWENNPRLNDHAVDAISKVFRPLVLMFQFSAIIISPLLPGRINERKFSKIFIS